MAARGIVLGRFAGAPVVLTRSWFVVAALLTVVFAPTVRGQLPTLGAGAYLVAAAFAVLLLVSVLIHEMAHAAAARAVGQPVTRIVLDLMGGHTQFAADATGPGRSFVVAVVGPLANAVIALGTWALLPSRFVDSTAEGVVWVLMSALVVSNAFVAGFNLLPGLPLDGGRLLEAAIWRLRGDRDTGTLAAGHVGRVVAVAVIGWLVVSSLLAGSPPGLVQVVVSVVVATFLWQSATRTIAGVRFRRRLPGLDVASLVEPVRVHPLESTVGEALAAAASDEVPSVVVLRAADGRFVGLLDADAVAAVPADRRQDTPVTATATPLDPRAVVPAGIDGPALLERLQAVRSPLFVVVHEGRAVGVLVSAAVGRAILDGPEPGRPRT